MKRLVDLLIAVLFIAIVGVGGYFVYTKFLAEEDTGSNGNSSLPSAAVTGSSVRLPPLSTVQIHSILPDITSLPPDLSGATAREIMTVNLNTTPDALSLTSGSAATSRFSQIRSTYNWASVTGITFDACALNRDTSIISVYVSQFANSDTARAFIDDPALRGYYRALQFTLSDASTLHGWYLHSTTPVEGTCFANEQQQFLFFDHMGLVVIMQINTNIAASAALGRSTLDALVPRIVSDIQNLDAFATLTIPPTPEADEASMKLLTTDTTQDDLTFLLPSTRDWDLLTIYSQNDAESQRFTLLELIDFYRSFNMPALTQLAETIDRAGRRYGLIAQTIRVWIPDTPCPATEPSRIEVDLSLFERSAGADAYMRDAGVQGALRGTGLFTEFVPDADGVYAYGTLNHACGSLQVVQKSATYERLLYTLSIAVPTTIDRQAATAQVDQMMADSMSTLYLQRLR